MMKSAVIILDLQNDFLREDGKNPIKDTQVNSLIDRVNLLIRLSEGKYMIVYVINEFSKWDYPANWFRFNAAIKGSFGCQMDERVNVINNDIFTKSTASAFRNKELDRFLKNSGIEILGICGVFAPYCVRSTSKSALSLGYKVKIIKDAVGSSSDESCDKAIINMKSDGAEIVSAQEFINGNN